VERIQVLASEPERGLQALVAFDPAEVAFIGRGGVSTEAQRQLGGDVRQIEPVGVGTGRAGQ
jgi:hypothetical protein